MQSITKPKIPRRIFLKSLRYSLLVGGGLLGWTALVEPFWLQLQYHQLSIPNLPESWSGRRLVHISDFHIGKTNLNYLRQAMEAVNRESPDLLVITGDLIDRTGGLKKLPEMLKLLKPAPFGTLACLGNHDFGYRFQDERVADQVEKVAIDHGIQVLRNTRITIDGLDCFGMEDYWSPHFSQRSNVLEKHADPGRASLCLCHNPDVCDKPVWGNFRGVILAGHTHGGQCKPPFLPPPILPVNNRRYTAGFFQIDSARQLYINRGLGHTSQVRFNCRPEITVFTLTRE